MADKDNKIRQLSSYSSNKIRCRANAMYGSLTNRFGRSVKTAYLGETDRECSLDSVLIVVNKATRDLQGFKQLRRSRQ
jgi:hypothetical protein